MSPFFFFFFFFYFLLIFHSKRKNDVASVLLLTDGQPTDGTTSKEAISGIVTDFTSKISDVVSMNTFGFGADHNPDLLRYTKRKYNCKE